MARGGIYDQLAGGFARYAVDIAWVVPHFEKMLYDNALLTRVYAHWWRATGSPLAERVARETADFLVRDLGTSEGGFASALDADAAGVEGLTYAWSRPLLDAVLGADDGERAADLLRVTDDGTFEDGLSTLQLPVDPADPVWWTDVRSRLLTARAGRPQPGRDDKVVTAWNGLAVAALADLGSILGEPRYVEAATRAATFLVDTHLVDGRLRRSSRDGLVGNAVGVADDYGDLAEGLLALHQATADPRWLAAAGDLLDTALRHFAADDGGFHDTADDAEPLFTRPRALGDNVEPSGTTSLAGALLTYGALTASTRHLDAASAAVDAVGAVAAQNPRFAGWALAVAEARAAGPLQVAVVGSGSELDALVAEARAATSPGLVLVAGEPDAAGIPLLADRPLVDGRLGRLRLPGVRLRPPDHRPRRAASAASGREHLSARSVARERFSRRVATDEQCRGPDVRPQQGVRHDGHRADAVDRLLRHRVVEMCASGGGAGRRHGARRQRDHGDHPGAVARVLDPDPPRGRVGALRRDVVVPADEDVTAGVDRPRRRRQAGQLAGGAVDGPALDEAGRVVAELAGIVRQPGGERPTGPLRCDRTEPLDLGEQRLVRPGGQVPSPAPAERATRGGTSRRGRRAGPARRMRRRRPAPPRDPARPGRAGGCSPASPSPARPRRGGSCAGPVDRRTAATGCSPAR